MHLRINPRVMTCSGLFALLTVPWFVSGCSSVKETTEEWEQNTSVSTVARLEYRIDSLQTENRRLLRQMDALSMENRNLSARNANLESQVKKHMETVEEPPPPPPLSPDLSSAYTAALARYRKRDFEGAARAFRSLLNAGIREDLQDNCQYWIGESYYGMGKYAEAIEQFTLVLNYARSEKLDDAHLMIGHSHLAMGNKAAAKEAYHKLLSDYPTSEYVRWANAKLSGL